MNPTQVRILVSFLGGTAFGGAVAGVVLRTRFHKKFVEATNDAREHYEKRAAYLMEVKENHPAGKGGIIIESPEPITEVRISEAETASTPQTNERAERLREKYSSDSPSIISYPTHDEPATRDYDPDAPTPSEETEDDDDDYDDDHPGPTVPEGYEDAKYLTEEQWRVQLISEEEYLNGFPGQTNVELRYFEDDDVLCDEKNIALQDTYDICGDWLDSFGEKGAPSNKLYLRNFGKMIDLDIALIRGSYQEAVLGIPLDEEDNSPRKMRALSED